MRWLGAILLAAGCAASPAPPRQTAAAPPPRGASGDLFSQFISADPREPPPFFCPEAGGAPWRSFTSEHFVLLTDLPERAARLHVAANERIEQGFETILRKPMEPGRLEVVEFSRAADLHTLRYGVGGWFQRDTGPDGLGAPRLVVGPTAFNVFAHELAHRFLKARIAFAPPWLNEGLAEYYQTISVFADTVEVGSTDFSGEPLPIGDVLDATRKEFYGPLIGEYYRTSWALVHMLRERDGIYAPRYTKYVAALVGGAHHDRAWKESFGDVPLAKLQDDLVAYMKAPTHELITVPFEAKPLPEPEVRVLSDAEVHLLFLDVVPAWNVRTIDQVRRDLAEARRQAPDSPLVAQWAATLAEYDGRDDEAERELRKAIATGTDDERFRLALARLHEHQAETSGAPVTLVEPEFRDLTPLARRRSTLNAIAWVHALANHPDAGLPLARRAVAEDPGCYACRDTLALLEFEKGDFEAALAEQERAVALVNDRPTDQTMLQHFELFRKKVDEKRAAAGARKR